VAACRSEITRYRSPVRIAHRIAARYIGDAAIDAEARRGADVIVRIEPGHLRTWDYADEFDTQ
jgi:hypothetical protein